MSGEVRIAIIGDYDPTRPSHIATEEAVRHCASYLGITAETKWYGTQRLEMGIPESFGNNDGVWCAPGTPYHSPLGALSGIRCAREKSIPFLGTCGGFQHAVMEFAINRLQMRDVRDADYEPDNPDAVNFLIAPLACSMAGQQNRVFLKRNSMTYRYYSRSEVYEKYTCNYGVNPTYYKMLEDGGLHITGTDDFGEARIMEWPEHPFFVATLFQPQLSSTPSAPHSLIMAFMRNAYHYSLSKFLSQ